MPPGVARGGGVCAQGMLLLVTLFQVKDHVSEGDFRRGGADGTGVLCDPIPGGLSACVDAGLVLADRERKAALTAANKGVADETFDRTQEALDLRGILLQQIEQFFGAFS